MMLAKDEKIKKLMLQRMYIKERLSTNALSTHEGENIWDALNDENGIIGDPSYLYPGYVYPENVRYFQKEGYDVKEIQPQDGFAVTKGRPAFLFTPSNSVLLDEKEMKQSMKRALDYQSWKPKSTLKEAGDTLRAARERFFNYYDDESEEEGPTDQG
ncbi:MAG: hypothetical protein ACI4VQ_05330 [Clostridia bacterium]